MTATADIAYHGRQQYGSQRMDAKKSKKKQKKNCNSRLALDTVSMMFLVTILTWFDAWKNSERLLTADAQN